MGLKLRNLDKLVKNGVNVHEYVGIDNIEDLINYSKEHEHFSMRFDRDKKNDALPFYTYDANIEDNNEEYLTNIMNTAQELGCILVCSTGHAYDDQLKFNFVVTIDTKMNYILEICSKKIPLRNMYKEKTTIIKGNLVDDNYTYINKYGNEYSMNDVKYIINWCLKHQYQYIEGTLYKIDVGMLKEKLIIWQTN